MYIVGNSIVRKDYKGRYFNIGDKSPGELIVQNSNRYNPNEYSKKKDNTIVNLYKGARPIKSDRINNSIIRDKKPEADQMERMIMNEDMRRIVAKNITGSTKQAGELTRQAIKYGRHVAHNEEKLKEKELAKTYEPLADSILNPDEEKESKEIIDETLLSLRKPTPKNRYFQAIPDQEQYANIIADRYGINRDLLKRSRVQQSDNDPRKLFDRKKKK